MAAYLSRLNHIALHVTSGEKIAHDLISKFKFNLFAARQTDKARQLALRKGSAVFVVNERLAQPARGLQRGPAGQTQALRHAQRVGHQSDSDFLYDVDPGYAVDTACNVCFEVRDVEGSHGRLRGQGCHILIPPTRVQDDAGHVTYSVVKSVVGNVCHTLIDRSKYRGRFLPGFREVPHSGGGGGGGGSDKCQVSHFDHITYACPRRSTAQVMRWNEDPEEGFVVDQEGIGLRLTAMQYWKCSEVGMVLPFSDTKETDCKFVVAESLPDQGTNQVDSFLEQHGGPGIQHVGLYTPDIVPTARTLAQAGVHFVSPPPAYYTEVGKRQEIVEAGHDPQVLAENGILLDTDLHEEHPEPISPCRDSSHPNKRVSPSHLRRVFTKPIFAEDTLFLELIERQGATGFGEGNIRALWRSVQAYMESEGKTKQG
ncbi:HPDL protein, partial [Amia calva]|nr:HPDL protein [Amia calva]